MLSAVWRALPSTRVEDPLGMDGTGLGFPLSYGYLFTGIPGWGYARTCPQDCPGQSLTLHAYHIFKKCWMWPASPPVLSLNTPRSSSTGLADEVFQLLKGDECGPRVAAHNQGHLELPPGEKCHRMHWHCTRCQNETQATWCHQRGGSLIMWLPLGKLRPIVRSWSRRQNASHATQAYDLEQSHAESMLKLEHEAC